MEAVHVAVVVRVVEVGIRLTIGLEMVSVIVTVLSLAIIDTEPLLLVEIVAGSELCGEMLTLPDQRNL